MLIVDSIFFFFENMLEDIVFICDFFELGNLFIDIWFLLI